MKLTILTVLLSFSALAQIPDMSSMTSSGKALASKVMAACKEDKSKIKGCDSYTDLGPLKECLLKNKDSLSPGCKQSLSLVK